MGHNLGDYHGDGQPKFSGQASAKLAERQAYAEPLSKDTAFNGITRRLNDVMALAETMSQAGSDVAADLLGEEGSGQGSCLDEGVTARGWVGEINIKLDTIEVHLRQTLHNINRIKL